MWWWKDASALFVGDHWDKEYVRNIEKPTLWEYLKSVEQPNELKK